MADSLLFCRIDSTKMRSRTKGNPVKCDLIPGRKSEMQAWMCDKSHAILSDAGGHGLAATLAWAARHQL